MRYLLLALYLIGVLAIAYGCYVFFKRRKPPGPNPLGTKTEMSEQIQDIQEVEDETFEG